MAEPLRLADLVDVLSASGLSVRSEDVVDVGVSGVSQDSRTTRPGDLFVAWVGTAFDAHEFVAAARERGAVAALVERPLPEQDLPQVVVDRGRMAAGIASQWAAGFPSRGFFAAGITGTNGKTSTALMARHVLGSTRPTAVIGTLGVVDADGRVVDGTEGLTTPGPVDLGRWMADLRDGGVRALAMEASSHALEQDRLAGVEFDVAVFTNLTQDHLDYHETLEEYRDAKARLLDLVKSDGLVVVNGDDPAWDAIPERARSKGLRVLVVGRGAEADLRALEVEAGADGTLFTLEGPAGEGGDFQRVAVEMPLLGAFNVDNALGAAAIGLEAGLSLEAVADALGTLPQIPGRLEVVATNPSVVIDFAHTPAALERVLESVRPLVAGRLIVVFGAGGDRDRAKRPLMGAAVARGADLPVVSSDNPRTEDPESIIDDVVGGLGDAPFLREADRRAAIRMALAEARSDDLVLLAGKGHETYQVLGTDKVPFDEREIVDEWARDRAVRS